MSGLDDQINLLLKEGKKLEAIKICRDNFNIEFADAKAYVEELIANLEGAEKSARKPAEHKKLSIPNEPEIESPPSNSPESVYSEFLSENTSKKPKGMFRDMEAFEGRIRRTEYALSLMLAVAISGVLLLFYIQQLAETGEVSGWLYVIYGIVVLSMWSQGARRCHDLGNSGWMQLVPFYFLWMIFQEGQPGVNEYGESPK